MTSAGSLVKSNSFFPKDSLLSGPAGGVVGAAEQAARSGIKKIIAFDMGGTSTDVSLYNERFDYSSSQGWALLRSCRHRWRAKRLPRVVAPFAISMVIDSRWDRTVPELFPDRRAMALVDRSQLRM